MHNAVTGFNTAKDFGTTYKYIVTYYLYGNIGVICLS